MNRAYGRIPQKYDERDWKFEAPEGAKLPPVVSQRANWPDPYDQGSAGCCTGEGIAGAYQYDMRVNKNEWRFEPSKLFPYYNARVLEGTTDQDAGAEIRDVIKAAVTHGICPEYRWPLDDSKITVKPDADAYASGAEHKILEYRAVQQTIQDIKTCLAMGCPIVFGFTVYESFESDAIAQTGIMPMPTPGEKVLGGHCVVAIGYDDEKQMVECRNSWGKDWGDGGYFWMPYRFILDPEQASDFWMIAKTL